MPLSDGLTERMYKNNERVRGPTYSSIDPLRLENGAAEFAVMFHVADISQDASDRVRTPVAHGNFPPGLSEAVLGPKRLLWPL